MDEVLEKMESTVITPETSGDKNNTFQGLYKNWGRLGNQEERRREILEVQKSNRNDKIDTFRGILELVKMVEEKNIFKPYNRVHYRPSIYVAGFHKASATYNNVLMLSEWIIEKPADFSENWYVVPCPKGVRLLLVAHGGTTRTYTKYGHFKQEFRSGLPGGNPSEPIKNRCCVLDCFYSEQKKIMYVLDLLAWNNQPMTDGEMEFRQYWLKSKLTEMPQLATVNKKNKIVFQLLPTVPCNPESFNKFMMTWPQFENDVPTLDGLLFYHKRAHYVSGETPLVGWLFPFMVQEVLGSEITVHERYLSGKPAGYVNQAEFIQAFEANLAKKRPKARSRRTSSAMDTSDSRETESRKNATQELKTDKPSEATELMEAEEKPEPVEECMEPVKEILEQVKEPIESVIEPMESVKEPMESVIEPIEPVKEPIEPVKEVMEQEPVVTEKEEKLEE